jgi:hypothetical protein
MQYWMPRTVSGRESVLVVELVARSVDQAATERGQYRNQDEEKSS